jgi:hypothetical protein
MGTWPHRTFYLHPQWRQHLVRGRQAPVTNFAPCQRSAVTCGWIRVGGILAALFGVYYVGAAAGDAYGSFQPIYAATVVGGSSVCPVRHWSAYPPCTSRRCRSRRARLPSPSFAFVGRPVCLFNCLKVRHRSVNRSLVRQALAHQACHVHSSMHPPSCD